MHPGCPNSPTDSVRIYTFSYDEQNPNTLPTRNQFRFVFFMRSCTQRHSYVTKSRTDWDALIASQLKSYDGAQHWLFGLRARWLLLCLAGFCSVVVISLSMPELGFAVSCTAPRWHCRAQREVMCVTETEQVFLAVIVLMSC